MKRKKIVYVDLDGVIADYERNSKGTTDEERKAPGFFANLEPLPDAIESFKKLCKHYEVYFLSTAPWSNIHAWSEKRVWVEKHFGEYAFKRLILSHNKSLLRGEYLIDDRIANGVDGFEGEHIHFGTSKFPTWESVLSYLKEKDHGFPSVDRKELKLNLTESNLQHLSNIIGEEALSAMIFDYDEDSDTVEFNLDLVIHRKSLKKFTRK